MLIILSLQGVWLIFEKDGVVKSGGMTYKKEG